MKKRSNWKLPHYDAAIVQHIADRAAVSPVVAQILLARGLTDPDAVSQFLHPKLTQLRPPESLGGALDVATQLQKAIRAGESITVCGDYDADGMTATTILVRAIRHLGGKVGHSIPSREQGYGLHADTVRALAAAGTQCIVTVDCGISAIEAADVAQSLGLRLLITDHHLISGPLPQAAAIAHPDLPLAEGDTPAGVPEGAHEGPPICGACVALKVAWALGNLASGAPKVSDDFRQLLLDAIGFATIGTIADVMPLIGDNRALVRHGLESSLSQTSSVGLRALLELCGRRDGGPPTSDDIGFHLAPRLNAAGRMGQEQLGIELLLTTDAARAKTLAAELDNLNTLRRSSETQLVKAAHLQIKSRFGENDAAFVLYHHEWPSGLLGIVASRLAEEYHRPVVVLANKGNGELIHGSSRSIAEISVIEILRRCEEACAAKGDDYAMRSGGHAMAAGLTLPRIALDFFREAFVAAAETVITPELTTPSLAIDAEFSLSDLNADVLRQIELMRPFGAGNRRPLLLATRVVLDAAPTAGPRHATATVRQATTKVRCVAFGSRLPRLLETQDHIGEPLDVVFHATRNRYSQGVEMEWIDWRPSSDGNSD